jgi:hypothetical protein
LGVVHERFDNAVTEGDRGDTAAEELPRRDARPAGGLVDGVFAVQGVEADIDLPGAGEREAGGRKAGPGVVGDVAGVADVGLLLLKFAIDAVVGEADVGVG